MFCSHSIDEDEIKLLTAGRDVAKASQIINLKIIIATTEVYLPIEDTTFHEVNASG